MFIEGNGPDSKRMQSLEGAAAQDRINWRNIGEAFFCSGHSQAADDDYRECRHMVNACALQWM